MPPPTRLTPSQRVFGVGVTPTYDIFRPPEGMELDPAYSPVTRRQQAAVMDADLQREAFADQRAQMQRQRDIQAEEDAAIEAMRGRKPEEFGEILSQFPGTARSKNLPGMLNYAQAVQPSPGQKTLAPSLRNRLKPHERQYFDEHFTQGGDAVSAFDAAQMRGEHENSLVEMLKSGVPMDVIDKYRDRRLSPIEREQLVQQHRPKADAGNHQAELFKDLIAAQKDNIPMVNTDPNAGPIVTNDDVMKSIAEMHDRARRIVYPEKYQQASVAPQAGAQAAPQPQSVVPGMGAPKQAAPQAAVNAELPPEHYSEEIQSLDVSNPQAAKILAEYAVSGALPLEAKREAVKRLGEIVKTPPSFKEWDIEQADEGKTQLKDAYEKARTNLEGEEVIEKDIKPAWTKAKSDLEKLVDDYAKKNGYAVESVYRSIVSRKARPVKNDKGVVTGYEPVSSAILGNDYMKENPHLKKVNAQIAKANNKESPIFARINRFLGGEKLINGDVLRKLAEEKIGITSDEGVALPAADPKLEAALQKYAPK